MTAVPKFRGATQASMSPKIGRSSAPRPRSRAQLTALSSGKQAPLKQPSLKQLPLKQLKQPIVRSLPVNRPIPGWLRLLLIAQRSSSAVTFLLVAVALVIYGWTVYSQQLWSHEYRKLEDLQRQERQMTTANEVLKHQIAREAASPTSGLVLPDPRNTIFLQPAPQRPPVIAAPTSPVAPLAPAKPLAY